MPTYEFRCPDGTIIEKIFKISEAPSEIPSPQGDGMAVRIISGGAGLLFKGSGFYITDYGKDGKKDQRDASAKEKAGSDASSSSSTSEGQSTKSERASDGAKVPSEKPASSATESKPKDGPSKETKAPTVAAPSSSSPSVD